MVDGGVSIAVRSVYPGKQARILSYEVLQEAKKTAGKVLCQAQNFIGMSSNRTIEKRVNDVNFSEVQGRGRQVQSKWFHPLSPFSLNLFVPSVMTHVERSPHTITGDLLSINVRSVGGSWFPAKNRS